VVSGQWLEKPAAKKLNDLDFAFAFKITNHNSPITDLNNGAVC
jgi:hypothetical protein